MCFDGNNTTSRILDILEEERPKVICIDELEKMSRQFRVGSVYTMGYLVSFHLILTSIYPIVEPFPQFVCGKLGQICLKIQCSFIHQGRKFNDDADTLADRQQ